MQNEEWGLHRPDVANRPAPDAHAATRKRDSKTGKNCRLTPGLALGQHGAMLGETQN